MNAKGSSRLSRSINYVEKVSEMLNPDVPKQSICDCVRLGKYSDEKKKNRPVLKMSPSYEVTAILANWRGCPKVSIKPILSKKQLSAKFILLGERWKLLQSGTAMEERYQD